MLTLILSLSVPSWSVIGVMAAMGFGVELVTPSRGMLVPKAAAACLGTGVFGRVFAVIAAYAVALEARK